MKKLLILLSLLASPAAAMEEGPAQSPAPTVASKEEGPAQSPTPAPSPSDAASKDKHHHKHSSYNKIWRELRKARKLQEVQCKHNQELLTIQQTLLDHHIATVTLAHTLENRVSELESKSPPTLISRNEE